jgi:hypothetical protein
MDVEPIWRGRSFSVDQELCFVLMPLKEPFNTVFQDHIKPTVERLRLRCIKADDIYGISGIMEDLWKQVCCARVIIAELTARNPNVFYEVGIAHIVGKDVILTTQNINDSPFDLRAIRHIAYEYTPRGCRQFEEDLERTLRVVISGWP